MGSCNICLDYIRNGEFCRPISRNYLAWNSTRDYYCDRIFIYGSIMFHSYNNLQSLSLHENTCQHHAREKTRLLNHFSFLVDPVNMRTPNYFTGAFECNPSRQVGYTLRRNPKSQSFTLYQDSEFEEKISEVHCEVILSVGPDADYTFQDVFWTQLTNSEEGVVYAKLQMTSDVSFIIPVLVLSQPFSHFSRTGLAYSKIWPSNYQEQPIYEGFARLISNCYRTINTSYESFVQDDRAKLSDSHAFFNFLLHQVGSYTLDILQHQLNFILPTTEDHISTDSILDISQPASQLKNPVLSFPSVQFLLKILYLRRNMLFLRGNSPHGSLFAAVNQSFSSYLASDIGDPSPHFVMSNHDIIPHSC